MFELSQSLQSVTMGTWLETCYRCFVTVLGIFLNTLIGRMVTLACAADVHCILLRCSDMYAFINMYNLLLGVVGIRDLQRLLANDLAFADEAMSKHNAADEDGQNHHCKSNRDEKKACEILAPQIRHALLDVLLGPRNQRRSFACNSLDLVRDQREESNCCSSVRPPRRR